MAAAERLIAAHNAADNANANPLRDLADGLEGSTKRIVVGGIEVGAKKFVGSEGKVIEKSVVVGGGKETFIGTVASSDGKQMSREEMKKLNIADPKDVELLKANLKKLAGKKGWKLDLVDTPRGREFRGIIDTEDQDAEKTKKKSAKSKDGDAAGMGKEKEKEKEYEAEQGDEEEEMHEGSEEVYKDEL
jgi:protein OS-9